MNTFARHILLDMLREDLEMFWSHLTNDDFPNAEHQLRNATERFAEYRDFTLVAVRQDTETLQLPLITDVDPVTPPSNDTSRTDPQIIRRKTRPA